MQDLKNKVGLVNFKQTAAHTDLCKRVISTSTAHPDQPLTTLHSLLRHAAITSIWLVASKLASPKLCHVYFCELKWGKTDKIKKLYTFLYKKTLSNWATIENWVFSKYVYSKIPSWRCCLGKALGHGSHQYWCFPRIFSQTEQTLTWGLSEEISKLMEQL